MDNLTFVLNNTVLESIIQKIDALGDVYIQGLVPWNQLKSVDLVEKFGLSLLKLKHFISVNWEICQVDMRDERKANEILRIKMSFEWKSTVCAWEVTYLMIFTLCLEYLHL